ncbi:hypothetical protein ACFL5O_09245, partial [Myxococcota bacterium]
AQLERCDPLSVQGWGVVEACASAEHCDSARGRCLACLPGQHRCSGWKLERCAPDGTGWEWQEDCPSAAYCDSRSAQCLDCLPGEAFCSGATLYTCNSQHSGWDLRQCGSPAQCNATVATCRTCFPGELDCNEGELRRCTEALAWESVDQCATQALCLDTVEQARAQHSDLVETCLRPVCEVGEFRCQPSDGTVLEGCPPSRDDWQRVAVCATAALCDADLPGCLEPTCDPGEYRCDGAELKLCNADGTAEVSIQTCQSTDSCNAAKADCMPCSAGEVHCNGPLLQQCSPEHSWVTLDTCVSGALCDSQAVDCRSPVCPVAGEFRCDGARLVECNAAQTDWELRDTCPTPELCDPIDRRCQPKGCPEANRLQCNDHVLVQCTSDLTGWRVLETCPEGQLCDVQGLGCIDQCPEPPFRCNGADPQVCVESETGSKWILANAPCATGALCYTDSSGAYCQQPKCGGVLPLYRCNPNDPLVLEKCNDGRTAYELFETCQAGQFCDSGPTGHGPSQCDICRAGAYWCKGQELWRCGPAGQQETRLQDCGSPALCVVSDSNARDGFCYACASGDAQCAGQSGQMRRCADDQLGWLPPESCDNGCVDQAGQKDYCAACAMPGEVECVQTEAPGSTRTCSADQRAWSATTTCAEAGGCVDSGQNDFCAGCTDGARACTGTTPAQLRECVHGQWITVQTCSLSCHDDGTQDYCSECTTGTAECSPDLTSRRTCVAGRWTDYASCGTLACHDSGLLDYCGQCTSGGTECSPDGVQRRTCNAHELWGQWQSCDLNQSGLRCHQTGTQPAYCSDCVEGELRCAGSGLSGRQRCVNGRWQAADCSGTTPICNAGDCQQCNASSADRCTNDVAETCGENGSWVGRDCRIEDRVCYRGQCADCNDLSSAQCSNAYTVRRCDLNDGTWGPDTVCPWTQPVCSIGACVACSTDDQCQRLGADYQCDSGGTCVQCLSNDECAGKPPICQQGTCVPCTADLECGTGKLCESGACVEAVQCVGDARQCFPAEGSASYQDCLAGRWGDPHDCPETTPTCDNGRCVCTGTSCGGVLSCVAGECVVAGAGGASGGTAGLAGSSSSAGTPGSAGTGP